MFWIENINLNNFRCYANKSYKFTKGINILCGKNATGKTSVLEAISYLSICKSFKNVKDNEIIKSNEKYFFINAQTKMNDEINNLIVSYSDGNKKIKKNNYIYTKNSDYIGFFNSVSFEPCDMDIVKGGPVERRKLLNTNICQIDKEYLLSLSKFNKYLKHRNDYLKQDNVDELYLELINDHLIQESIIIIRKRKEFVKNISKLVEKISNLISSNKETITIEYIPNVNEENIQKKFKENKKYDLISKTTNCGPQRDDVDIKINGKLASIYASQGQTKTAVISIKLALSCFFEKQGKEQVILLDDVFSELDDSRQEQLLKLVNFNKQIFITTTNVNNINKDILKESNIIDITKEE